MPSSAAYNQGVGVFSMASDNDAGSPAREYNSPAPSQGLARSVRPIQAAGSIKEDQYDTDRTRSVSPSGSHTMAPQPKPAGGMRITTLLNDEAPTPPAAPTPAPAPVSTAAPTPTPVPSKGPGRGNWGHRRKEKDTQAITSTPNNHIVWAHCISTTASCFRGTRQRSRRWTLHIISTTWILHSAQWTTRRAQEVQAAYQSPISS